VLISGGMLPSSRVTIKEQEQVKWPAKNTEERSRLIAVLKDLGRCEEVADLDTYALSCIFKGKEGAPGDAQAALQAFGKVERSYIGLTVSKKRRGETE
jgi:hypothetical protein